MSSTPTSAAGDPNSADTLTRTASGDPVDDAQIGTCIVPFGPRLAAIEIPPKRMVTSRGTPVTLARVSVEEYLPPVTAWGKTNVDCADEIASAELIVNLPVDAERSIAARASEECTL